MMQKVILVPLLILGWTWTLNGFAILPEPLYPTQENFDLAQFLGTWHDVAVATSCPHMQRHRTDAAIGKLILQRGSSEDKLKMTRTVQRSGICREISGDYELTTTPGRFSYHVAKYASDVDAYVVHTNYNEYGIVIMSMKRSSGQTSISLKLYSRTMEVRDTVLEDFKTLVKEQGMSDDTIIIKQNKGDCVPGEVVAEPARPEPQVHFIHLTCVVRQCIIYLFNNCCFSPDTGPCFGLHYRYYYNASSMSCDLFKYGGCLGNQNNFVDERECLQRCRTEAVCRLPLAPSPCTGKPLIWAFDSTIGVCVPYKQGYCQTNGNKFYSKAECAEYCGVKEDGEIMQSSSRNIKQIETQTHLNDQTCGKPPNTDITTDTTTKRCW
uniref:Protein AMBP n=1 Tax=Echeneis naucrates TaxID=173247 RepID=A0A665X0X7_ECHNA